VFCNRFAKIFRQLERSTKTTLIILVWKNKQQKKTMQFNFKNKNTDFCFIGFIFNVYNLETFYNCIELQSLSSFFSFNVFFGWEVRFLLGGDFFEFFWFFNVSKERWSSRHVYYFFEERREKKKNIVKILNEFKKVFIFFIWQKKNQNKNARM